MIDKKVKWIETTQSKKWNSRTDINISQDTKPGLTITEDEFQELKGFGGCFNEAGWYALSFLDEDLKKEVLDNLFGENDSCGFNICRLPIGASDYALKWYSHNETEEDFQMENFSIERDYEYLIPYIKEGLQREPDMELFASPWSPPTWMKRPAVYNYGTLRWEDKVLEAYALYFLKFVKAYQNEGIKIDQIHVQNEPVADQKFPSCVWTGEELRDFIRDYLGPLFEKEGLDIDIWLGTLNTDKYDLYPNLVLSDHEAKKYITGVGFQWDGKGAIQKTKEAFPDLKLMQTENECGDGENTWQYAHYVFSLIKHYFMNGVESYVYWNMILQPGGESTWGWNQNSMITIEPDSKEVSYNPEFFLMKHFSRFIKRGAVRIGLEGQWSSNTLAFRNPDGQLVIVVANPFTDEKELVIKNNTDTYSFKLKEKSFNTIIL